VFYCPEPGCKKTYLSATRLEHHLIIGNHETEPDKESLRDYALRMYGTFIENRGLHPLPLTGEEGIIDIAVETPWPPEDLGWALAKPGLHQRFTADQKQFLEKLYWEGEATKLC
jgi:hypothetical protein